MMDDPFAPPPPPPPPAEAPGPDAPGSASESGKAAKARTKQCRCSKCIQTPEGFRWLPTSTASDHAARDKARGMAGSATSGSPVTKVPKAPKVPVPGRKRGRPSNASRAAEAAALAAAAAAGDGPSASAYPPSNPNLQFSFEGMGMFAANQAIPSASGSGSGSGSGPGQATTLGQGIDEVAGEAKAYVPVWQQPPPFMRKHLKFPSRIVGQTTTTYDHANTAFRPYLTLTWAQSLDAKIAGPRGARVILSGKESMEMTHWMRAMHHGIVIGVNTLLLDNPRLQVNLLPPALNLSPPAIFILDPNLRTPTSARILTEWTTHMHIPGQTTAARPTILCGAHMVWTARYRELEAAGAAIFGMQLDKNGHIPPQGLVSIFTSLGIRSAMIEGGSRVISSFLHAPKREDGSAMIDSVVVTVAPMFIGDGVSSIPLGQDVGLPAIKAVHTTSLGKDTVMVCTT